MMDKDLMEKVLAKSFRNGGDFADIFLEETSSLGISCEDKRIERITQGIDKGIGLRLVSDFKTYYGFTNDFDEDNLLTVASDISSLRKGAATVPLISLKRMIPGQRFTIKERPYKASIEKKVALVKRAEELAWGYDKRIKQVKVNYSETRQNVTIANSFCDLTEEERIYTLFAVHVVAYCDGIIQTGYETLGGLIGLEIFKEKEPEIIAEIAARRAIMMLEARRAPAGKMVIVLSSEAGGTMIHEAIGHGLEADLVQEGLSVFRGKLGFGMEVASKAVSVVDDATLQNHRGSFLFDDEGIPSQRTILVENGVLKGYLYDRISSLKDNKGSTGNGRRQSYRRKPIPRMTNTFILPGEMKPEDIIRSVEKGLFVKKMGGGQVNTVNGDFVFEVSEGYLIDKGKVGEPVRGATLTGNGPEVLKMIDMVGTDLGFGIGTCGKDGQGVPVSDGQPTLRIPEIIVGGEVSG